MLLDNQSLSRYQELYKINQREMWPTQESCTWLRAGKAVKNRHQTNVLQITRAFDWIAAVVHSRHELKFTHTACTPV